MSTDLSHEQRREVRAQVTRHLAKSQAFSALPRRQQEEILAHTGTIVEKLAERHGTADPYATDLAQGVGARGSWTDPSTDKVEGRMTGNTKEMLKNKQTQIGGVIAAGVTEAGRMVREINFPAFVASLVEGTFHAIVKSSIEQMQAYAEMVKSVSSSLSEFRDQNTTDNQARDHLVERYPQHFQITVVNGQPRMGLRPGAEDLPSRNILQELGAEGDLSSLDEDSIEEKLVPAARDDLARGRQQLLATIVMMGINRIVVTDGKINAKIKFEFRANENQKMTAQAFDYVKTGNVYTSEGEHERTYDHRGGSYSHTPASANAAASTQQDFGGTNVYAKGTYKSSVTPDIRVTSQVDTSSTGAIQASGQIMGEVSINFKSETFPLEKMVDAGQMMNMEAASAGGRRPLNPGTPRAAAPPANAPASGGNRAAPAPPGQTNPPTQR